MSCNTALTCCKCSAHVGLKTSISSKKNKYEVPDERLQHIIHQGLKRRWCVDQAEWHDQELEVTALASSFNTSSLRVGMKTVRIFSNHIRDRIRLERFRSVRIRVRIFNIQYRIRIQILKSHICDVDTQYYRIRHSWYYPYSNPNPNRNMKTNVISVISVLQSCNGYRWATATLICACTNHWWMISIVSLLRIDLDCYNA